jgi:hypothetical protein
VEIPATLRYVSRASARFRGAGTGRTYAFSAAEPVQQVHPADVDSLLRTGLFHAVR